LDVLRSEPVYLFDDDMVFFKELSIFLLRAVLGEVPAGCYSEIVKITEYLLFLFIRDSHVVFNGIQAAQNEIENANLRK
jgi:hypothetical protein